MCKECLIKIASTLTVKAQRIFNILAEEGKLNKTDIENISGLSYAITEKKLLELYFKQLVNRKQEGRSMMYWLSEEGKTLSKLLNKGEN